MLPTHKMQNSRLNGQNSKMIHRAHEWVNEWMNEYTNQHQIPKKKHTYTCVRQPGTLAETPVSKKHYVSVTVEVKLVKIMGHVAELNLCPCPILAFRLNPNPQSIWLVFLEGWPPSWVKAQQILECSEAPTWIITALLSLGNPQRFSLPLWSWNKNILIFRMLEMTCIPGDRETTCPQ